MSKESPAPPLEGGSTDSIGDAAVFGVVTVSDRASAGIYNDESGPAILQFFSEAVKSRCCLSTCCLVLSKLFFQCLPSAYISKNRILTCSF